MEGLRKTTETSTSLVHFLSRCDLHNFTVVLHQTSSAISYWNLVQVFSKIMVCHFSHVEKNVEAQLHRCGYIKGCWTCSMVSPKSLNKCCLLCAWFRVVHNLCCWRAEVGLNINHHHRLYSPGWALASSWTLIHWLFFNVCTFVWWCVFLKVCGRTHAHPHVMFWNVIPAWTASWRHINMGVMVTA